MADAIDNAGLGTPPPQDPLPPETTPKGQWGNPRPFDFDWSSRVLGTQTGGNLNMVISGGCLILYWRQGLFIGSNVTHPDMTDPVDTITANVASID